MIVVPGLPTTVFFIVAAACFARSNPRLEQWVLESTQVDVYKFFGVRMRRGEAAVFENRGPHLLGGLHGEFAAMATDGLLMDLSEIAAGAKKSSGGKDTYAIK